MERIKTLYQSLTKSEIRHLKTHIQTFPSKGENKAAQFIRLLEKKADLDNAKMAERLYGDPRSKAFIMLKRRLTERILDIMSNAASLSNNTKLNEDSVLMKNIVMHKMLVHAKILKSRGLTELTREILGKCLDLARETGHTEVELQALAALRTLSPSYEQVVNYYDPAIEEALESYRTDLQGIGSTNELALASKKNQIQNFSLFAERIEARIDSLQSRLDKHYSKRAHIYLLSMKIKLHQMRKEYDLCQEVFAERAELFEAHPGLASKNRLGANYFQMAQLECRTRKFALAEQSAMRSMSYFPPRKSNHHKAVIIRFTSLILLGRIAESQQLLTKAKSLLTIKSLAPLATYYSYFEACIAYFQQDYKQATHLLQEASVLVQDKSGWNVHHRILEIMISIDEGELSLATTRIENLRKHLSRHEIEQCREHLIFRFLYHLERNAFSFSPMSDKMLADLNEMRAQSPWRAIDEELTRFDVWVKAHQLKRPFYAYLCEYLAEEGNTKMSTQLSSEY